MSENEFLSELRACLAGALPQAEIESNLDYYRDYIEGELAKGRKIEEITEELGEPNVVAHTVITGFKMKVHTGGTFTEDEGYNDPNPGPEITEDQENGGTGHSYRESDQSHSDRLAGILTKIVVVAVCILAVLLVVAVVTQVFTFVIRFFWPILAEILSYLDKKPRS